MKHDIVLFGCPHPIGGANTEAGDTAILWRDRMGLPVTILPASEEAPDNPWPARLADFGCKIAPPCCREAPPPWLRDKIVVDFAIERAVNLWPQYRKAGCRLIHCPTQCETQAHERNVFRHNPPTAVMFESQWQRTCLTLQYTAWGVPEDRQFVIHGAFEPLPFAPRPHQTGTPLRVGRLARPVTAKWPRTLFPILAKANEFTPIDGRCMGWTPAVLSESGSPPDNVTVYPPEAMPVPVFLSGLHAMLCLIAPDHDENWSRVGLEALSSGTPVIADGRGGWREMIDHNETGILVSNPGEAVAALVRLARDEPFRQRIIRQGMESLAVLTDYETIGKAWRRLFSEISGIGLDPLSAAG